MQTKLYTPLIFCGMGGTGTGGEVGNCRIRTILRNDDGRDIFTELSGLGTSGSVMSVFYYDSDWDRNREISNELTWMFHSNFEYTNDGIINFVNKNLKCSFSGIEITDEYPHKVLCCSSYKKSDYKDNEININVLDGINPIVGRKNTRDYRISYETMLEFMADYVEAQDDNRKEMFPGYKYYTGLRFDDAGIITDMHISSDSNFCFMSFGSEDMQKMIEILKGD